MSSNNWVLIIKIDWRKENYENLFLLKTDLVYCYVNHLASIGLVSMEVISAILLGHPRELHKLQLRIVKNGCQTSRFFFILNVCPCWISFLYSTTPHGLPDLFQFYRWPCRTMNFPSTLQRMIDAVLKSSDFAQVYLDYVVVHSKTMDEQISYLQKVFALICRHGLNLIIFKC